MTSMAEKSSSKTVAPYGRWTSPISADLLAQKRLTFGNVAIVSGNDSKGYAELVYIENRPWEKGRAAAVHRRIPISLSQQPLEEEKSDQGTDVTLGKYNARTAVHEYGGGALAPAQPGSGKILFSDVTSNSVFETEIKGGNDPVEVTPPNKAMRYADFCAHPTRPFFLAIREDHTIDEPAQIVNTLVCVEQATGKEQKVYEVASGHDFYAAPRFSYDGSLVAWVSWNHPSMPFWATTLHVAHFDTGSSSKPPSFVGMRVVGGQQGGEVLHHPLWSLDENTLLFTSDKTDFAQPYSVDVGYDAQTGKINLGALRPLLSEPVESDFLAPAWSLGNSSFSFLSPTWLACIVTTKAIDSLALLHLPSGQLHTLDMPFVAASQLCATSTTSFVFVGATAMEPDALVAVDVATVLIAAAADATLKRKPTWQVIKRSSDLIHDGTVDQAYLSQARNVEFPTTLPTGKQTTAHAIVYAPKSKDFMAPTGSAPPAIIMSHGGPTAHYRAGLNLEVQYWTTRGFLVCQVNYGGSTGYGREYMERLMGTWGQVDVRDCVAAAQYLGNGGDDDEGISSKGKSPTAETKAQRRVTQQGQAELANLEERRLPSGAVEITLRNTDDGGGLLRVGLVDALLTAAFGAAGHFIPGGTLSQGLIAAGVAWLFRKLFHVQYETIKVIPTVGIEMSTTRGMRLPFSKSPPFVSSTHIHMIPRDCIMDLVTNEAFQCWRVVDYLAVATRSPPSSSSSSSLPLMSSHKSSNKLDVLFPSLLPRLPVVEHVYRTIYPALFGHDSPMPSSSSSASTYQEADSLRADAGKIAIAGGSAGGYSVLCGLCMYPHAFKAGVSRYGVADLVGLEALSHKFESRYLHQLVGGSPSEVPQTYHDRSPLHFADRIRSPVLFLQGDQDKVVPPSQSEEMYEAVRGKNKAKYVLYPGEGHGFRDAKHITDSLAQEEAWYRDVFDL